MDKANEKSEGLKIEEISVDSNAIKAQSVGDQIMAMAKDKKVMKERTNVFSLLDELEGKSKENAPKENDREDRE